MGVRSGPYRLAAARRYGIITREEAGNIEKSFPFR